MDAPEATLTIHGLEGDAKFVRADVFARKLKAFLKGLAEADKFANGKQLHVYVIEDLRVGSAVFKVREKQKSRSVPRQSAIRTYHRATKAVYDGERSVSFLPEPLIASIEALSAGTEGRQKQLDHAEVSFDDGGNIIRIDDFLKRKAEEALRLVRDPAGFSTPSHFKGTAFGSFDGQLKMLDNRGQLLRASLVTTAGDRQLDCVVSKELTNVAGGNFDRRVRVDGLAHYDGEALLPIRIDVRKISPVSSEASLQRWRGALAKSARGAEW
jgi:hypothetical protein